MGVIARNEAWVSRLVPGARERLGRPWFGTVLAASGLCVAYLVGALLNWGDAADRSLYANLGMLPAGLATTILAWSASRTRQDRRSVWAWRLLALGFAGFFAGDALYFTYQNILGKSPFPSLADAGYLIYYPFMLAGLLSLPTTFRDRVHRLALLLDCVMVVLAGGMLISYFLLIPTLDSSPDDLLAYSLSVGYPAGDLLLLAGIAYLLVGRGTGGGHSSLFLLGAGLIVGLGADLVYGYQSLQGSLQAGGLSDAGYLLSWLLFAWASYSEFARAEIEAEDEAREGLGGRIGDAARASHRARDIAPYGFLVVGPALLLYASRSSLLTADGFLVLGTTALVLAVVVRQLLAPAPKREYEESDHDHSD